MNSRELSERAPTLAPFLRDERGRISLSLRGAGPAPADLMQQLVGLDALDGVELFRLELYDAGVTDADLEALATTGWLARTEVVDLTNGRFTRAGLTAFTSTATSMTSLTLDCVDLGAPFEVPAMPALERLSLAHTGLGDAGLAQIEPTRLPQLRALRLRGARSYASLGALSRRVDGGGFGTHRPFTQTGFQALSAIAPQLEELDLGEVGFDAACGAALASAGLATLRTLDLSGGTRVAKALNPLFSAAPNLRSLRLTRLEHTKKKMPDATARAIAKAPFIGTLERLLLHGNKLSAALAAHIVGAASSLVELDLSGCQLGADFAAACTPPSTLQIARLMGNAFDDSDVAQIISSLEGTDALAVLGLSANTVGASTAAAMARSSLRPTSLGLSRTKLTDAHLLTLLRSPVLDAVQRLHLAGNRIGDAGVEGLIEHGLDGADIELKGNQITPASFARLSARMPERVHGAKRQRQPPPELAGSSLAFVLVEGGDPVAQTPNPGKAVKALNLYAHSCNNSRKWFVGYVSKGKGHELAFISARGKRVDPKPPIFVPPMKYDENLVFAVDEALKIAAVICVGVGLFIVDLETGTADAIDEVSGVLGAAVFHQNQLIFTRQDTTTMLEIYEPSEGTWSKVQTLETGEVGVTSLVARNHRMATSGKRFSTQDTPATFYEQDGAWRELGRIASTVGVRPFVGPGNDQGVYLYLDYKRYELEPG